MTHPQVSVIIPVFNCRDTVGKALESVFAQTLPAEQIEIITVDDGSTDGSAELLDGLARAHDRLTVIHQPNSGGAGAPRNRALELASGEYVFFLDSDDWLGPEALERMVAMAERNGTDIVLGKQVGVGGRKVPRNVFDETIERTHILDPGCELFGRMSMAVLQLFRRSLVEEAGLRFVEGVLAHEDQLFTAGAYLRARGVSVLADYDCYYWANRADGTSNTQTAGAATPAEIYEIITRAMQQVADHTEPGEIRERLHDRYLRYEVISRLVGRYPDASADDRAATFAGCRNLLDTWYTPGMRDRTLPLYRLIYHCVLNDLRDELDTVLDFQRAGKRPRLRVEDGRAFQKYPYFRDAAVGIPDNIYETAVALRFRHDLAGLDWRDDALTIGGTVVHDIDGGVLDLHVVLENGKGERRSVRCATVPVPRRDEEDDEGEALSYTAEIRPGSVARTDGGGADECLTDGRWTIALEATLGGHSATVPIVKPHDLPAPTALFTGGRLVRPLPVRGRGALELDVDCALSPGDFRDVEVGWASRKRLRVSGSVPGDRTAASTRTTPAISVLLRRTEDDGAVLRVPLVPDPHHPCRRFGDLPLAKLRPGLWRATVEVEGAQESAPVLLSDGSGLLGPVTTSLLPPRRVHVPLARRSLTVHVTVPMAARMRWLVRRPVPSAPGEPR